MKSALITKTMEKKYKEKVSYDYSNPAVSAEVPEKRMRLKCNLMFFLFFIFFFLSFFLILAAINIKETHHKCCMKKPRRTDDITRVIEES